MSPIDPVKSVPAEDSNHADSIRNDEDHANDLVDWGLRVADSETREAAQEVLENEALSGDDLEDTLEEIAREEALETTSDPIDPESSAVRIEDSPEN